MDTVYKDLIIRYNQNPVNYFSLKSPTHSAEGYNQICGDEINIFAEIKNNCLKRISFTGDCCAVAKASASLMIEELENHSLDDFSKQLENLEQSSFLKELKNLPSRKKCATLPWATLKAAIDGKTKITTEK